MTDATDFPPWNRLMAGATPEERALLHEYRRLLNGAGLDLADLARPAGEWAPALMATGAYFRLLGLQRRLVRLGVVDRLAVLNEERRAAEAGPQVQTMITFGPTDEER